MKYFNYYALILEMMKGKIDFEKHLGKIRKEDVIADLRKKGETLLDKSFIITNSTMEEENFAKLPQNVKDILDKYNGALNSRKVNEDLLKKMLDLKKSYPNVPMIYNFLMNTYGLLGDKEKQEQTIIETIEKFPNYFFSKTALCHYYLLNSLYDKIPAALDNKLEIYHYAPRKTNIYHVSEVRAFYSVIGSYYLYKDKTEHALLCYILLRDIDKAHPETRNLGEEIVMHELKKVLSSGKKNKRKK